MMKHPIICLDPGHGDDKPGATGEAIQEHVTVWDVCRKVQLMMDPHNNHLIMTRPTVWDSPTLKERTDLSNKVKADIFVSVHANVIPGKGRGIETFHYRESANGILLATCLQENLVHLTGAPNRGVFPDTRAHVGSLYVLKETKCPAALIEIGDITDPTEAAALRVEAYLMLVAQGIMSGLVAGLRKLGKMPTNIQMVR